MVDDIPCRVGQLIDFGTFTPTFSEQRCGRALRAGELDAPQEDTQISDVYQEHRMQVVRWGNSLAVRLPAAVVEALQLKEGDEVEIHVADARRFGIARKPGREQLLKRLRAFRGRLPADFKFDRNEANAR